jgi:hypothetical protein
MADKKNKTRKKQFPKQLFVTNNNAGDSDQYFNPSETIEEAVENFSDYSCKSKNPVVVAEYRLVGNPLKVKKQFIVQ